MEHSTSRHPPAFRRKEFMHRPANLSPPGLAIACPIAANVPRAPEDYQIALFFERPSPAPDWRRPSAAGALRMTGLRRFDASSQMQAVQRQPGERRWRQIFQH
jgi:hypothetical protein